jgi:hypothetical protein
MADPLPIHHLRAALEAQRLLAVEELSAKGGNLPAEALQKLAAIQAALTAVSEEIKAHEVKVGGGSETPLA